MAQSWNRFIQCLIWISGQNVFEKNLKTKQKRERERRNLKEKLHNNICLIKQFFFLFMFKILNDKQHIQMIVKNTWVLKRALTFNNQLIKRHTNHNISNSTQSNV